MTKGVPAALAYRLWCSFKRRWILMLIFIAIPIILSGLFMVIKAKGLITKSSAKMEGPIVHPPITKSDIMGFGLEYTPIAVSPNNSDTRRLIELVAQTFEKSGLTFGPAEFFDTDILAAKYMADMAKKSAFSFSNGGFGIHFSQLSPTKLEYTLRSIHTQGWYTTMGYPSQMIPGPMDNGQFYFAKGFAPLQLIINDAYSQSTLNVSLPNWEIQPFPYPMYEKQDDYALLYMFMEMMNTFGLTFLLSKFSTMLITEKASGIKELLKLNGVKTWMIYASWYNMFGLISALIALIVTIFWKYPVATGAVLPWTNPFILFIILVSYYWNALASVGFISSLITEPKYGMMFTVLYWIGSNTLVNTVLQKFRNRTILIFLGLLPNGAIYGIMEAIAEFEAAGSGATFSNLYSSPPVQTLIFPIGVNLALMLLSSIIYLTLMAYVDAIKPGPFGRARPWHFIFPKFSKVNSERTALLSDQRDPTSKALIEDVGEDTPVGLQIVNVLKVFGSLRAVDNLSVTIYKNQITALLGHNGAGKSTLFSMICGMFSPTSGSVYTGDFDVFQGNNLELFRRQLGFCPQHDLLIDELTVEEHLLFFGMVKGLTREEAKVQSDHWTDKFKLREGRHKRVAELSGGMKRKLCISIALVGNPQYLLLDEPTSGLDPESRRDIWDVLLLVRGNRTIVISTHFMEEADVLGDRIAIVAHGTLKCYGTGMFLKKHYGSGYQLNVTLKNDEIVRDFLEHVKQLIPEAAVMKEAGRSFSIGLPAHDVRKFPEFFRMIESRYGAEIESSLSCTNMDDVFLKVQESEGVQMTIDEVDMPTMLRESHDQRSKRSAISRVWQQCEGFFIKRFMWAFYNWPSFIFFMIACPALGMYVNMSGCNQAQEINSVDKLILSLTEYPESIVLVNKKAGEDKLASVFESLSMKSGSTSKQIQSNNITKDLLDMAVEDLLTYRSKMVVAFDNSQATPNVLYSTLAYHSIPIAIEMLYNSLLRNAGISATISASSYPYNFSEGNCQQGGVLAIQTVVFWIMFAVTMLVTTSYFIMFPHTERITYLKHLQIMTGAQPVVYWLTNFIADFTLYIIPVGVSLLFLVLFDSYKMYEYCIFYGALILVLLLYGMGGILAAYFASYFLKSYTSAMELYLFLQNICAVISLVGSGFETTEWFPYVFYLLPWIPFARSISKLVDWAAQATLCFTCQPGQAALCKLFIDQTTFKTFDMKMELIYLAVDPFVYLALILAIDHGIPRMMLGLIRQVLYGKIDESGQQICDLDVASEKETVDAARGTNQDISSQTIFVCDDLGKKYSRSFTAVYDVTFGVQKGECFGLLGVNGAGKSTTFAMLTGSTNSTKGDSRLMKYSLKKERHNYLKGLGYCPQLDGLLLELSARTLLKLFGRLRGIPPSQLDNITQKWIDALDMTNICDRPCKEYSGGNKRKLSTAMALIADPPVVLLDEPTTGVDPVVRRKIWSILKYCREKNGQTIIITSHSMDECEAVCGRLTIMVKGQMKCIGTIPRLKKVYGRGCILLVKFGFRCSPEQEREVQIQIEDRFNPYISLQDKQHGLFNYHINSDSIKLYTMFETMNSLKTTYPVIEDFSLSDISLEQVFLSLAKGRDASPSTK